MRTEARPTRITPLGEYDQGTVGWVVHQTEDALADGAPGIVIDLEELEFGGSTLIGDIIRSRSLCAEHGATFALRADSAHWHRLFQIAGVTHLLDAEV